MTAKGHTHGEVAAWRTQLAKILVGNAQNDLVRPDFTAVAEPDGEVGVGRVVVPTTRFHA